MTSPQTPASLSEILNHIQSSENVERSHAEHLLETEWLARGPEKQAALLVGLTELAVGGDLKSRAMAAVLLRRYCSKLLPHEESVQRLIDIIDPAACVIIRAQALAGLTSQQPLYVRHKLADAVAEIARITSRNSRPWPELVPTLYQAFESKDPEIRECVLRVFSAVPEVVGGNDTMISTTTTMLKSSFADENGSVRIAGAEVFRALFQSLPKTKWPLLAQLLSDLLNVLQPLKESKNMDALRAVLESLIDLAELAPKMFKPVFSSLVEFVIRVAADREIEEDTRLAALEFLTTFAEVAPNMCQQDPEYIQKMVFLCLQMLTEIGEDDDDASEWNNSDDIDAFDDDEPISSAANASLDRIALRLDGPALVACLVEWLPKMCSSANWRERHGVFMALSNVAEGCRDILLPQLGELLNMILPHLNDPHSRVQWAACNALGQMSTDFADVIQKRYGSQILPALISKLSNESTYRVQAHAAAAVVNFCESASKEIMDPYLDNLLSRLLQLLNCPKRFVQEQVLTTIAIVADAAESRFVKYYDTLMPLLLNVLKADTGAEHRLIKAKSVECSTLIALAVGKQKFEPHLQDLVQTFIALQMSAQDDEVCQTYLAQGWGRLCRVLGSSFLPYLNYVMPPLLTAAKAKADIQVLDKEEAEVVENKEGWQVIPLRGQYVGMHTSTFDEKASAIDLLCVYADELGADFYPYVPEIVTDVILPGLSFFYDESVREATCLLIPFIITCAQKATNESDPQVLEIWMQIFAKILELMSKHEDTELSISMLNAIQLSVRAIGPAALPENSAAELINQIAALMNSVRARLEARGADDNDEFVEDQDGEDVEEIDIDVTGASSRLIRVLFKTLGEGLLPAARPLLPLVFRFLELQHAESLVWALCVIADILEYSSVAGWAEVEPASHKMIEMLGNSSPLVRQSAAYAIGVAAQHAAAPAQSLCLQALEPLFTIAAAGVSARQRDDGDEEASAAETATASIAKILRTYGAAMGTHLDLALREWVKALPILDDRESAQFAYLFLADLLIQSHPGVIEQPDKVFYAVTQALVRRVLPDKAAERIIQATQRMLSGLPEGQALSFFQALPAEQQEVIRHMFS